MWTSRVERTVEAAHHNGPTDNKCYTNHGHSWHVVVLIDYETLDYYGWGPDFHLIKRMIDRYDHKDLNVMFGPNLPPSAENFAVRLHTEITDQISGTARVRFVEVKEGNKNSVRYHV